MYVINWKVDLLKYRFYNVSHEFLDVTPEHQSYLFLLELPIWFILYLSNSSQTYHAADLCGYSGGPHDW